MALIIQGSFSYEIMTLAFHCMLRYKYLYTIICHPLGIPCRQLFVAVSECTAVSQSANLRRAKCTQAKAIDRNLERRNGSHSPRSCHSVGYKLYRLQERIGHRLGQIGEAQRLIATKLTRARRAIPLCFTHYIRTLSMNTYK